MTLRFSARPSNGKLQPEGKAGALNDMLLYSPRRRHELQRKKTWIIYLYSLFYQTHWLDRKVQAWESLAFSDTPELSLEFGAGSERSSRGGGAGRKHNSSLSSWRNGELCAEERLNLPIFWIFCWSVKQKARNKPSQKSSLYPQNDFLQLRRLTLQWLTVFRTKYDWLDKLT